MGRCLVILTMVSAAFPAFGSEVKAQSAERANGRLFGQFELGLAGEASVEIGGIEAEADLDPSPGFAVGGDVVVHRYIAIGGLFRFLSISGENSSSSFSNLDFDVLPRLRLPLEAAEIYLAVPIGFSLGIPEEGDNGRGWNVGFKGGVQYLVSRDFALLAELGYLITNLSETQQTPTGEVSSDLSLGQLLLTVGFAYVLSD